MDNALVISDLTVRYGEHTVLEGINATVPHSEIRVVLGPSGCGKTTLLKTAVGLIKPFSGTIALLGEELGEPDAPRSVELLKRVGVLFQGGALLGSLTSAENVALPLQMHTKLAPPLIREIVRLKLTQVDLPHAADLYPGELSGGMRKRVALARALALDPPLLFCDEPSAGLDPTTSAGLDDLLLRLRKDLEITIVVVTHELFSIEKIADSIIFLYGGKLAFDGTLADAKTNGAGPLHDFFARKEKAHESAPMESMEFAVENTL